MRRDTLFAKAALKEHGASTISVIGQTCSPQQLLNALNGERKVSVIHPQRLDHLEHYGSREGLSLGPLTGYAVLYRFVAREGRNTIGDLLAARNEDF
jgi:hypothetical protein